MNREIEDAQISLDQMKNKGEYIDTDFDSSTRILSEVKDDSNLLQQDQTPENDSIHTLDLTETIGSEENVMQTVVLSDGITYYGQLVDGEPSGYGTLTDQSGNKYEGQFYKGTFNGNGTKTFSDGMILSCKWRDGNPIEDAVTMIFPGGNKYIGAIKDFKDDEFKGFKGYGTYYHDGSQISAYWDGAETIGKVTWIHPDKSKYEGELKDFKMHGKGVLITDDGTKYEGDFVDGRLHGYGTVTTSDGKISSSGLWKNGEYIGKIKPKFK